MATTLVLLPGLDGTGLLFEAFAALLPPEIAPVIMSYPGDRVLTYEQLLEHIRTQLPTGPFVVLGESFSGPLAIRLACSDSRVTGAILCASFVTNPLRYVPRAAALLARAFWFRLIPAFVSAKALLGRYSNGPLRSALASAHDRVTPAALASRVRSVLRVDVRGDLERCRPPIMYLAGRHDRVVGRHSIVAIKRLRGDIEVVEVSAPHLLLQTAPEASVHAIALFCARAAAGAAEPQRR